MELNLIGALTMFKTMDMVPNFSELARTFGRDRHTIKKMYEGKGRKRRKKRAPGPTLSTSTKGGRPSPSNT